MKESIRVSCQKANLRAVREFSWQMLESVKLPDTEKNLIVLAIDEVCANLIVHSHNCDKAQSIEVEISVHDHQFVCKIFDIGEPFDIVEYTPPEMDQIIRQRRNGGMGLILVKKIMDKIKLESKSDHHVYTLTKSFE